MPKISLADLLDRWTFNLPVALVLAVALAAYLLGVRRAAGHGLRWPLWRTVAFVVLGLGSVAFCTMSVLAAYNHTLLWPLTLQVTLLLSIVPVCLALGDPLGLTRAAINPRHWPHWDALLHGRTIRTLCFPVLTPFLALFTQFAVFFTGYLRAALDHGWVMDVLYLNLLVVGSLIALPLLTEEMLPSWCTDGLKFLFAMLDGLLDAIPGIAVFASAGLLAGGYYASVHRTWGPTPSRDQQIGGALMVVIAEVVALPLLVILFFRWARNDLRAAGAESVADPTAAPAAPAAPAASTHEPPPLDRPWWETDPRFHSRQRGFEDD